LRIKGLCGFLPEGPVPSCPYWIRPLRSQITTAVRSNPKIATTPIAPSATITKKFGTKPPCRPRASPLFRNSIKKLNCVYCEYVNGLIAYVQEIAGRTEQNWCPIKHAMRMKTMHSRYRYFIDYGDAEQYRKRIEEVRTAFEDLKKES
jgi:hypothetical protein